MRKSVLICFAALCCASLEAGAKSLDAVRIEPIEAGNCSLGSGVPAERSFLIYKSADGVAQGWSHVVSNPARFPLVALDNAKYAVDERALVADEDCGEQQVFRTVLVRKMSNWGQQHANGLEPTFFDRPVRVRDLESVTVVMKLNGAESRIPGKAKLAAHYGPYLSAEQIDGLDRGVACLGFTFVENGYNNQETETLNVTLNVSFDPAKDFDKWLRVTVPMEAFRYGFEQHYATRGVDRETVLDHELVAFRINPETTGGIVSRNYLNDTWDDSVPELYKEMSLSLARVEARLAVE